MSPVSIFVGAFACLSIVVAGMANPWAGAVVVAFWLGAIVASAVGFAMFVWGKP